MTEPILFAVCLGGNAPGSNTELHDIVFVSGTRIEETYPQLLAKWFGQAENLHIDSWQALTAADGHRIRLASPVGNDKRLYLVNLGTYADGTFGEVHANGFFAASSPAEAKIRAKAELLKGWPGQLHTDAIVDVAEALGAPIALEPDAFAALSAPVNGYHPLPETAIAAFLAGKG